MAAGEPAPEAVDGDAGNDACHHRGQANPELRVVPGDHRLQEREVARPSRIVGECALDDVRERALCCRNRGGLVDVERPAAERHGSENERERRACEREYPIEGSH